MQILSFTLFVTVGSTNQHSNTICMLFDLVNSFIRLLNKIVELKEITRCIATNRQFAEQDEIATLPLGFFNSGNYFLCITFEIADVIILLR